MTASAITMWGLETSTTGDRAIWRRRSKNGRAKNPVPAFWGIGDYCDSYPVLPGGDYLVVAEISYYGGSSHKFYMATGTASLTLVEPKVKMKNLFFSDFVARFPALLELMEKF